MAAERLRRVPASCCGCCGGERPSTGWRVSLGGRGWLMCVPRMLGQEGEGGSEGGREGRVVLVGRG